MFLPKCFYLAHVHEIPPRSRGVPVAERVVELWFFFLNVWKVSALVNVLYTVTINGTFQDLFLCLRAGLHSCLLHFARRVLQHILKNILKTFWFFFSGSQRPGTVYPSNTTTKTCTAGTCAENSTTPPGWRSSNDNNKHISKYKSIKKTSTNIKALKRIWTNIT